MRFPLGAMRKAPGTANLGQAIVAGLLALGFLADPVVGAFTWIGFRKAVVRKEVRRRIVAGVGAERLVVFKFKKEEADSFLRWEHPGEFEYDGQMYDVVETWTHGNTIYYRCWRDEEETRLNSRLKDMVARALGKPSQVGEKNAPWNLSLNASRFIIPMDREILPPGLSGKPGRTLSDPYSSIIIRPPTPPPRLA
jgi:hypothetical protein